MAKQHTGPAKWLEYAFARALCTLISRLPLRLSYWLGRQLGWMAWRLLKRRREQVFKNLAVVKQWAKTEHPEVDAALDDLPKATKEVFLRNGANLFGGLSLGRMSAVAIQERLEIQGFDALKAAANEGAGVVMLLAHMGPWEVLAHLPQLGREYGLTAPFGAIYRQFNNSYMDSWFKGQRERNGTRMFGSRYRFYAPVDFLRSGGILGVLADQRASGGEDAVYFGQVGRATPLPGLLHLRSRSKLFALSLETVGFARWRMRIREIPSQLVAEDRSRAAVAQLVSTAMEDSLCDSLLDGFWFHKRFK